MISDIYNTIATITNTIDKNHSTNQICIDLKTGIIIIITITIIIIIIIIIIITIIIYFIP